MSVGFIPAAAREAMSWLEFTAYEREMLERLVIFCRWNGSFIHTEGISELLAKVGKAIEPASMPLQSFVHERICSEAELELIARGTHAHYSFDGRPSERVAQFFEELLSGYLSPNSMTKLWDEALEANDGDEIQAITDLRFKRPLDS